MGMKSIKINVTDRQLKLLDLLSIEIGLSRSEYLRRICDEHFKKEGLDANHAQADDKNR